LCKISLRNRFKKKLEIFFFICRKTYWWLDFEVTIQETIFFNLLILEVTRSGFKIVKLPVFAHYKCQMSTVKLFNNRFPKNKNILNAKEGPKRERPINEIFNSNAVIF
jgi:hypothetical protein